MKELLMNMKNLPKHFKTALINIWRNGAMTFSSIFAVTITLLLIGVIGVLAVNVQDISSNIESGVRIYVKLDRNIDENSERLVQTITITQKGKYNIKIVSEDGSLISSYQFTKNDPINNTTKIILICVACGVVVLVVLFLLVRRKGKYR